MTEYNDYAKRLDAAFNEAAEAHNGALATYQTAKDACKAERDPAKRQLREAELAKAKDDLRGVQRKAWTQFRNTRDDIERELKAAVKKSQLADPDALDGNAMTLINSGTLTGADLAGMADKYADNATMLRMIGEHAKARAGDTKDRQEQKTFTTIAYRCRNNRPDVLEQWDALRAVSADYSGEHVARMPAETVSSLCKHWKDDNIRAAIDNF